MILILWLSSSVYSIVVVVVVSNLGHVSTVTGRQRREIEPRSMLDDFSKLIVRLGWDTR